MLGEDFPTMHLQNLGWGGKGLGQGGGEGSRNKEEPNLYPNPKP